MVDESLNPFVFDRPLEDQRQLVGREEELAALAEAIAAGAEVLVEGPHRHGKTSLVNAALAEFAAGQGGIAARVDCAGVLTPTDFVRRLEEAYAHGWASGPVEETLIERLRAVPFRLAATADPTTSTGRTEALLAVPAEVAEQADCRAVLCFDEVQDALTIPPLVEALQHARSDRVGLVFAGRELSALTSQLWSEKTSAVTVETIEPALWAAAINERFRATGRDAGEAAEPVSSVGACHPQRTSLLAAELWELTPAGERATVVTAQEAVERALARSTPELETRLQALHGNERRVAVALAQSLAPQGTRAQRATGLAGPGAAQRALQGIISSGVAERRDDQVVLTDPLFAEWLRRRYEAFPVEPDWQAFRTRERERGMERGW